MKHKVCELEGALLDAAVALALGRLVTKDEPGWPKGDYKRLRKEYGGRHVVRWYSEATGELGGWEPIENWGSPSSGGEIAEEIIDSERINTLFVGGEDGYWQAGYDISVTEGEQCESGWLYLPAIKLTHEQTATTRCVAALRSFVASKFGNQVDLP